MPLRGQSSLALWLPLVEVTHQRTPPAIQPHARGGQEEILVPLSVAANSKLFGGQS